jgi:hypothetical protein
MKQRQYVLELGGALTVYAVLLVISLVMTTALQPVLPRAAFIVITLLPMIGAALAVWAIVRGVRRLDELQRRIQFEALAFAFAGTAFLTFGYGFLENAGQPKFPTFGIWPLMAVLWVTGLAIARRRYA